MLEQLKQRVYEANMLLPHYQLITFTWGNVSEICRDLGLVVIKPSGVDYDYMTAEHMVVVDLQGNVIEGDMKPSSDTATHLALYKAFPDINAVVHTHSRSATIWAQACCDIPALGTTHADYFYGSVPCTRQLSDSEIDQDYERNTGSVIIETFQQRDISPRAMPGCLVASHGPFTWGSDADNAVHNAVVLEEVAAMALSTLSINAHQAPMKKALLDKHYLRKHGENAYYGQ
jgi:L-ribulose-5-phosphate 4-epimerase